MIILKNIQKIFTSKQNKIHALDNINLEVKQGEILGIIGLSGAGKSTLIRIINRLEEPTSGQVIIEGRNILDLKANQLRTVRKNIGMIFQHFNLLHSRDVSGNIALSLELMKKDKSDIKDTVSKMLSLVGLDDKANARISELSGGQKQRVAIARALATSPKILLSDEATSALDPKTTKEILSLIKDLRKELNLTVVLITHEMDVIKEICDRVAVIEAGKIVEEGPVEKVFDAPKEVITKDFLKAV